jgi:hypothetical protein
MILSPEPAPARMRRPACFRPHMGRIAGPGAAGGAGGANSGRGAETGAGPEAAGCGSAIGGAGCRDATALSFFPSLRSFRDFDCGGSTGSAAPPEASSTTPPRITTGVAWAPAACAAAGRPKATIDGLTARRVGAAASAGAGCSAPADCGLATPVMEEDPLAWCGAASTSDEACAPPETSARIAKVAPVSRMGPPKTLRLTFGLPKPMPCHNRIEWLIKFHETGAKA